MNTEGFFFGVVNQILRDNLPAVPRHGSPGTWDRIDCLVGQPGPQYFMVGIVAPLSQARVLECGFFANQST
jgi:hypothetical protein